MNRPDTILAYDEMDLKLGIKSSLPHVKSTLALAVLLWECSDHPAELTYSVSNGDKIVLTEEIEQWLIDYLSEICEEEQIDFDALISGVNQNQLFKSQMEALIVAFELVWKLAKVNFVDETKPASAERTGGVRYPKKLTFSVNADIIHSVISGNENAYIRVLMSWIGFNVAVDPECAKTLTYLFTALSEGAVFKLVDGTRDVIFNQNSIYKKILETSQAVDINGDKEAKVVMNTVGNIFSGQVVGETAKTLSERFGKVLQKRQSISINRQDVSTSINTQLDALIPASKISNLSQGTFVGSVSDNFGEKIDQKIFHAEIVVDHAKVSAEEKAYKRIPVINDFKDESGNDIMLQQIQRNYDQIKADAQVIINEEMERIKSDPELCERLGLKTKDEKADEEDKEN